MKSFPIECQIGITEKNITEFDLYGVIPERAGVNKPKMKEKEWMI